MKTRVFLKYFVHDCTLLSELSVSNSKVDTLTTCLREVVSDQEIDKQKIIDLQKELSEVKSDQELCSIKLNESLQELNSLNPKSIKRKIDRREQKISELTGVNDWLFKKLNESLLNEEKLKDEIKNSSIQSIEYQQEIDHLNKLLDEFLIWKKNIRNFSGITSLQWKEKTIKMKF